VPERACRVDWVAGASLMVRREVFDAIGPLDEGYFMYFEEVAFCLKAARAGWPCWYVPTSRIVHLVGQSSGVTRAGDERKRLPPYWFEARRRYFLSNYGRARTLAADLLYTAGYSASQLRRLIGRKPAEGPRHLFRDFIRHNFLPARLR
jgi:N-acetylglucosaminyl-diphospho-decaprenol L-rhamnosyltransferase